MIIEIVLTSIVLLCLVQLIGRAINHPYTYLGLCFFSTYSKAWDEMLNNYLDSALVIRHNEYTITFRVGGTEYDVWVANYPYSYGYMWFTNKGSKQYKQRPKRKTMLRLRKFQKELGS